MLLRVGDFICGGRTCSAWQFHICLSEAGCLAFLVQWLMLSLFWAFLLCCSNIFSFPATFFSLLFCMYVLQYLPSQKGGKRLLAYFPVDIWADAQVSQWRLWWKSTCCRGCSLGISALGSLWGSCSKWLWCFSEPAVPYASMLCSYFLYHQRK